MSLGEIQEVYSMLQQIASLLDVVDKRVDTVQVHATGSYRQVVMLERILFRAFAITSRLGLSGPMEEWVGKIERVAVSLRMLTIAANVATAAMGPWGVLWASLAAVSGTLVAADSFASMVETH
jgi:hypothetical protein